MKMNARRWFWLAALVTTSAIFLSVHGWRMLKRSEWLQHWVQRQLEAKFGGALHYAQLEASLAGVHLYQVRYTPPAGAFSVSVEEISVTFRLWEVFKSIVQNPQTTSLASIVGFPSPSADSPAPANYHLDITIDRPSVTLIGDWRTRLKNWMPATSASSPQAAALDSALFKNAQPPAKNFASPRRDSILAQEKSSRPGGWDFIEQLDINNGKILWDLQNGEAPFVLADEIEGDLDPMPALGLRRQAKLKSEALLSGKLLAAAQYNFFARVLLDLRTGNIDSIKIGFHEIALQQLANLSRLLDTTRTAFYKDWNIAGGVLNGKIFAAPQEEKYFSGAALLANWQAQGEFEWRGGQIDFSAEIPLTISAIHCSVRVRDNRLQLSSRQRVNRQPMHLTGTLRFPRAAAPEIDWSLQSDSLEIAELLRPFLRGAASFPMQGRTVLRSRLTGTLTAPHFTAKLQAPQLLIFGQKAQQVSAHLSYAPRRADGLIDSTLHLLEFTGALDGLRWNAAGEMNVLAAPYPLKLQATAAGEATANLKKIIPLNTPRSRAHLETKISGSLLAPAAIGKFAFSTMETDSSKLATKNFDDKKILGNFSFYNDTLRLTTTIESFRQNAPKTGRIELNGEVTGLTHAAKKPAVKIHGRGVEWLPAFLGKALPANLAAKIEFDTFLEGYADSLNLYIGGRHKTEDDTLFQLFGYLRALDEKQSAVSGELKLFPGAPQALHASFSAIWQDSIFQITDMRAEDWLAAHLKIATRGAHEIEGGLKLTGANFSRLLENLTPDFAKYAGNLFGEIRLGGTLSAPHAGGNFWLLDGQFNGIGKFAVSGEARVDGHGWEIRQFAVRKNESPFLQGTVGYRRATREPYLDLRADDIPLNEFLGVVAGVPQNLLTGRLSFDLQTGETQRAPNGEKRWPLLGSVKLRQGKIVWFGYDEIVLKTGSVFSTGNISYINENGIYFPQVRYEKKNEFVVEGDAYLPFSLEKPVDLSLRGDGNFLAMLPDFSTFFLQTAGTGHLDLNLVGPYKQLKMPNSHLRLQNGFLKMNKVAPEAHDIFGEAVVDSHGIFINVLALTGKVGDASLHVRTAASLSPNFTPTPSLANENGAKTLHEPLKMGKSPLRLGTIFVKSSDNGLLLNIPGLMEKNEVGRFVIAGQNGRDEFLVTGPWAHPLFHGRTVLENVDFMFPFDEGAAPADSLLLKLMLNSNWDVAVESRKDNRYAQKTPSALDKVYVNFGIDDALSRVHFTGILQDNSFRTEGQMISTHGTVEYLDLNFRVEKFGAEFDKSDWLPIVYGRAWTTMTDSTNFPYNVYLTLHTVDAVTRQEVERGRLQNAYFKLSSDRPDIVDHSQERILAALGYSLENVRSKATEAVGISTDNLLFRPLIRTVERQLERHLGLDVVRLSSRFTRNLLVANFNTNPAVRLAAPTPAEPQKERESLAATMLQSTRLLLGKYLWNDLYLNYIAQVENGPDELESTLKTRPFLGLELRHTLGLEYRINPAMLLQFEYDYNPLLAHNREDRKIWLRHSFPVEFGKKDEWEKR